MINGFEDQTHPLTEYEQQLIPVMRVLFNGRYGKSVAITNAEIIAKLKSKGHKVGAARIRKLINHIRTHNLIPRLMATSAGYYITNDPAELKAFIESLNGRIEAIAEVRDSMVAQLALLRRKKTVK